MRCHCSHALGCRSTLRPCSCCGCRACGLMRYPSLQGYTRSAGRSCTSSACCLRLPHSWPRARACRPGTYPAASASCSPLHSRRTGGQAGSSPAGNAAAGHRLRYAACRAAGHEVSQGALTAAVRRPPLTVTLAGPAVSTAILVTAAAAATPRLGRRGLRFLQEAQGRGSSRVLADSRSARATATACYTWPQRQLNPAVHKRRRSPVTLPSRGAPAGGARVLHVAVAALCTAAAATPGCPRSGRAAPPCNDGRHGCRQVCGVAAAAIAQRHAGCSVPGLGLGS